jgi:hypothetical protein
MPKGMQIPVGVGPNGGALMQEGSVVIGQNIVLAVLPASSLHPFHQNIAPEEELIFEIRDMRTGGLYVSHVREFFKEMEQHGYARLFPGSKGLSVEPSPGGKEGEMIITIRYTNLETNKNEKVQFPISGGER